MGQYLQLEQNFLYQIFYYLLIMDFLCIFELINYGLDFFLVINFKRVVQVQQDF